MKEIKFNPYDYNNNIYINGKLHIVVDNFDLVALIKEKLGYDMAKFMETIFDVQMLESDETQTIIETSNNIAIEEFTEQNILPIFNKLTQIIDDNKISSLVHSDVHEILTKLDNITTKLDNITTKLYKLI